MANDRTNSPEISGTHIWLRYTTQFTTGKRNQTIEVGIPVPIGASAETRERLIREAEAGMEQLAQHMERRVEQMQRAQVPQPAQTTQPAPTAVPPPRPASAPAPVDKPAASSPAPARDETPPPMSEQHEVAAPPTRPNLGATMPIAPGLSGDLSGSISLPQFIQYIKDLGLDARKAMDMLGVRSLQGLNYREALDQLQQMVMREPPPAAPIPASEPARESGPAKATQPAGKVASSSTPAPSPSTSSRQPSAAPAPPPHIEPEPRVPAGVMEIKDAVVRDARVPYGFDEEDDFAASDDDNYLSDLTEQERERAQEILTMLRAARGSASPNEKRFQALRNVVNDQVSDDQLEELIAGVWGTTSLKKLKDEQLEALISWAKRSDDFIADVDMVLTLLQEESYARSDR